MVVLVLVKRLLFANESAEVVNVVDVDATEVRAVEDLDTVEVVEIDGVLAAIDRFVFAAVAVTVTTVGNFAEQKLPASGTSARGFKRA